MVNILYTYTIKLNLNVTADNISQKFIFALVLKIILCILCMNFSLNGCVEGIVQRLKTYKDPDLVYDIKVILSQDFKYDSRRNIA